MCPGCARPGHAHIRLLLGNDGVPFLFFAGNIGAPAHTLIVELLDLLNTLHEPRELFELSPLIVGSANRYVHVDRFLDVGHCACSSFPLTTTTDNRPPTTGGRLHS